MDLAEKSTEELMKIASVGGGLVLDAAQLSTNDLVRIAGAGASAGARIVFSGVSDRNTSDLVWIARAGKGCVQFRMALA